MKNMNRGISIFYESGNKIFQVEYDFKTKVLEFFYWQFYFELFFLRIQGVFYLREKNLRHAREHILTALLKCFAIKDLWVGKKNHSARNWCLVEKQQLIPYELSFLDFQELSGSVVSKERFLLILLSIPLMCLSLGFLYFDS